MAKIKITETNGASAKDISDAIGKFLEDRKNEMIAYCGLDCEKCDAYIATKNDDPALREKTAKLWSELNNAAILPEHINCEGCRRDGKKTVFCESLCPIRVCALEKGFETCGGCAELEKCEKIAMVISNNRDALANLRG